MEMFKLQRILYILENYSIILFIIDIENWNNIWLYPFTRKISVTVSLLKSRKYERALVISDKYCLQ